VAEIKLRQGWLYKSGSGAGPSVRLLKAHPTWYYSDARFYANAIMAHYTATDAGTAKTMAQRRMRPRAPDDHVTSWHITIDQQGVIWQMVPVTKGAWHCASERRVECRDGAMRQVNRCAVGIELEGHGDVFTEAQVQAACEVWRVLVRVLDIPQERAMLQHSAFSDNRRDPGPVWMREHAQVVLDYAFLGIDDYCQRPA
jgi:N-acetyl-anhydromuramyl-L-alanine amidase AmpD